MYLQSALSTSFIPLIAVLTEPLIPKTLGIIDILFYAYAYFLLESFSYHSAKQYLNYYLLKITNNFRAYI